MTHERQKVFVPPFRYELDEDDRNGPITIRDLRGCYVGQTDDEDKAQVIVEALSHYIIEQE